MSESKELARHEPAPPPAMSVAEERFVQSITMIREAMLNPNVDADKAKTMGELMMSLEDRSMKAEFNRDINAAIMEMPVITKDGRIIITKDGVSREQGRFAKIEDIDRVVRPIAARHNIAYSWDVGNDGGSPVVSVILTHANGFERVSSGMKLPVDSSGGKNNVQGAGSAVTYGKRYTLCAAFNIQTEGADDDGNGGRGRHVELTYERGQTVLSEAEAAAAEGRYREFFARQSPKDRAWLITSGHDSRLGGDNALPAPKATPPPPSPPPPPPPQDSIRVEPAGDRGKRSPEQMTADYIAAMEATKTRAALSALQDKSAKFLEGVQEKHDALHQKIADATQRHYAKLVVAEREAQAGPEPDPADVQYDDQTGDDLFGSDDQ